VFNFIKKLTVVISCLLLSQSLQAQLDDPTLPPNVASISVKNADEQVIWNLSSILISSQRSIAIINGQSVKVGDTLAGARIKSISETVVKLKHRGKTISLELFPVTVKTVRDN